MNYIKLDFRSKVLGPHRPSATSPKSAGKKTLKQNGSADLGEDGRGSVVAPTCRLIAREEKGIIEIDTVTSLHGVPPEAWEYQLGTYSALRWILERYKEKKPRDPTIREKFNTYKFVDYKEQVIDLLRRVCTVSVETVKIVKEMRKKGGSGGQQ